jgi:hydroxymethylpyrimidine/phosphomethylpyrimidine kinase / thiaminase
LQEVILAGNFRISSGAGIQADLKTFTALSVYGASVITCVTSQNTKGVDGIHPLPASFVKRQLNAVLSHIPIHAIKTGMLLNKEIIETIVEVLSVEFPYNMKLVVDPGMVATSGSVLLEKDAIECLRTRLLPLAFIVTPNFPEAKVLLGEDFSLTCLDDMKCLAKKLAQLGPKVVLLKGGYLALNSNGNVVSDPQNEASRLHVIDVVYLKKTDSFLEVKNEYIKTKNTHGTGCTLSASIAAKLTTSSDTTSAILESIIYVHGAIQHSFDMGQGSGPLNHFHSIVPLSVQKYVQFTKEVLE